MSSQTGSPDGASALCGRVRPSASATTCEVAAVPRNWQPPPGVPQARQPMVAASSTVMRPCAKRAPIDWTLPASSPPMAGSVTPPGTTMPGRWPHPASASIVAGSPLSQVAMPITPRPTRQRADQAPHDDRRVVAIRQAVEHAGRALGAAVARIAAVGGKRHDARLAQRLGGGFDQQADLPVARCDSRARSECRRASRRPPCVLRIRTCALFTSAGFHPMPASWVMPNRLPLGSASSISGVIGRRPSGPWALVRVVASSSPSRGSRRTSAPHSEIPGRARTIRCRPWPAGGRAGSPPRCRATRRRCRRRTRRSRRAR